jgi:hypothetical protein
MSPLRAIRQGHEANYQTGLRSAVRGLWSGEMNWFEGVDSLILAVQANFMRAWEDGMAMCGIRMDEMTLEESSRLEFEINLEISHIYRFVDYIALNSRANKGKLKKLYDRLDMWTNRYTSIRDIAMTYACQDQKLMWVMGYTKEHCEDCQRLDGRVYRSSVWRSVDLYPKKHTLACGGWRCACELVPTSEPCTPGRPPRI